MRIEVTEDDIKRGVVNNAHSCPIALAVCRGIGMTHGEGGAISVRASGIFSWWKGQTVCQEWDTPPEARLFLHAFDRGEAVQPFGFDLSEGEVRVD